MHTIEGIKPNNLDHAVELLTEFYVDYIEDIKDVSESEFTSSTHHGGGQILRNNWNLWWFENSGYDWPKEKPEIVKYFNGIDIYHADDMSAIIMASLHRSICGRDRDLEGQLEIYKKHWKEQGYVDGIFRPEIKIINNTDVKSQD